MPFRSDPAVTSCGVEREREIKIRWGLDAGVDRAAVLALPILLSISRIEVEERGWVFEEPGPCEGDRL